MKLNFKKLGFGALLVGALCMSSSAMADTISGSIFVNGSSYPNSLPDPSHFTGMTPGITFTLSNPSNPFLFSFYSANDADLTHFLTYGGDTLTYLTGGDQVSPTAAGCPTSTVGPCAFNNDVFEFTGNVLLTNGQTYNFTHDDGMNLYIDGTQVISAPAPTAAEDSTFTWAGVSGTYSYSLWYTEVNGSPAVLQSPDFGVTPEPSSLLLLGTGLFALAMLLYKRKANPSFENGLF